MKVKFFFPCFARRDRLYTPLYTAFSSGHTTPKYLAPVLLYLQAWLGFCGDYPAIRLLKFSLAIPKQRALL